MIESSNQISINPRTISRVLALSALVIILASLAGQLSYSLHGSKFISGFSAQFNVDGEFNIPTFFSVMLLLSAALLLAIIASLNGNRSLAHAREWAILSLGFICMACDEMMGFHERLMPLISELLGQGRLGVFYFAWVIPGIFIVMAIGIYYRKFILHLPRNTRLEFIIAAALYLGGVIGLEMVAGQHVEIHGMANYPYIILSTAEEGLEMAGAIIFIRALMRYIAVNHNQVTIRFDSHSNSIR